MHNTTNNDEKKQEILNIPEIEDDPICLMPFFTKEEVKSFKLYPDVMVLHIELDADLKEVKDLAEIKFPDKKCTISRDILVPKNIRLHNLHYAINQAFGFTHSHLHEYTLTNSDFEWFTEKNVNKWKKYVGLLFKNPIRDEHTDFWDDDYNGGSPKKWMRSKYTGPMYKMIYEETYAYGQEQINNFKVKAKNIKELPYAFYLNPLALNETLPVCEILSSEGIKAYKDIKEYNEYMEECFNEASIDKAQPHLYSFAKTINYEYDFGDGWDFTIKAMEDVKYLEKEKRITREKMKKAIKDVCTSARPVVIAADGLPLVEDVGGVHGYMDFLKGINGLESEMYADKEESLAWAKDNGWPVKIGNLKTLL